MQGDAIVSLLVCLSLLSGIVVGLRFNVKLLLFICLAAIAGGIGAAIAGALPVGQAALTSAVTVVALQVGYFVAVVITAMRLTEEPITVAAPKVVERKREVLEARRS